MKPVKPKPGLQFYPPEIRIKNSPGRGRGVFASRDFKKNEIVEIAPALYISNEDLVGLPPCKLEDYFFASNYEEDNVTGRGVSIGLGYTSLYNHKKRPNATYWAVKETIIIKATKDIKKNEEIFIDYGWYEKHFVK